MSQVIEILPPKYKYMPILHYDTASTMAANALAMQGAKASLAAALVCLVCLV